GGGPVPINARLHIGKDGAITVFAGKVEGGQGARAELTEAAAEELRVPIDRITIVLADTALVPNDGMTAGSGTTPNTVPAGRPRAPGSRRREKLAGGNAKQKMVGRAQRSRGPRRQDRPRPKQPRALVFRHCF